METTDLIITLREFGNAPELPLVRVRELLEEAADRLEELDERVAMIEEGYPAPRPLTLDELRNVKPGTVLWEKQNNIMPAYPVEFKGFGTFFDDETKEAIEFGLGFEEVAEYGKQYILWTAKPTDEHIKEGATNDAE